MGPRLLLATIVAEDKRFFDHGGVDPRAVARAVGQALAVGFGFIGLMGNPILVFIALFVLLPVILLFGFIALFTGLTIRSGGILSWWMLPASATLTFVLFYVLVTLVWGTLTT